MKRLVHAILVILAFTGLAVGVTGGPASAYVGYNAYCGISYGQGTPVLSDVHGVQAWIIYGDSAFYQDQYCQVGKTKLIQQTDGNFVVYDENHHAPWATGTMNSTAWTDFQPDGNLVTYRYYHTPMAWSGTCCHNFWKLAVQADGNVVIYDENWVAQWATHTNH